MAANVGNIARLCAANKTDLHLVGHLGFLLSNRHLKRAGLDYWNFASWQHFPNAKAYFDELLKHPWAGYSTKAKINYVDRRHHIHERLVFGGEDRGLPDYFFNHPTLYRIPMQQAKARSLNLSTSVAIVLYEALRQANFNVPG